VNEGSLLCVAGANGSGKSTLLRLMAGLLSPAGGSVAAAGLKSPGEEKKLRRSCALVLQDADSQILGATVREDLLLGLDSGEREKAHELAGRFGLEGLLDRPVHSLSWGQKRRLTLAATLARRPSALLLDEPFAGLDYPGAMEMRSLLADNKASGLTQVVAAHDLDPLADLADAACILHGGRIVIEARPDELGEDPRAYGVKPPRTGWEPVS
jgi:biotin transport system ATP-binding protein